MRGTKAGAAPCGSVGAAERVDEEAQIAHLRDAREEPVRQQTNV
jgi:hypothetical protein